MTTAIQPCRKIDCCPPNDLAYSIVNGQVYTNPESSFVYDCPPGFVCQPGIYPKTVIIPETPWQPPPHDPSKPQILSLPCCSGLIVETLPIGSTQADYDAAIASMLAAFAQAEADCKNAQEPNRPAGFIVWNDQMSTSCTEPDETLVVNWGGFPYNIYYDGVGLVMPAHVVGASTLTQPNAKASANAYALQLLTQVFDAAIASGQIECVSNIVQWSMSIGAPGCDTPVTWSGSGYDGTILAEQCCFEVLGWFSCYIQADMTAHIVANASNRHVKIDYTIAASKPATTDGLLTGIGTTLTVDGVDQDSVGIANGYHNNAPGNWSTTSTYEYDLPPATPSDIVIECRSIEGSTPTPFTLGPCSGTIHLTITNIP